MGSNNGHIFKGSNGSSSNGSYNGIKPPSNQGHHQQDSDEIDLKRLFFKLWNHRWKIVNSVIAFTILAGIIAFLTTPVYESEGKLLISQPQDQRALGNSDLAGLLSSTYGIGMGSTIINELQVLRSRKLSLEMADSLMHRRLMDN